MIKKFRQFFVEKEVFVSRKELPQVRQDDLMDFINFLKKNGVRVTNTKMRVSDLKPTQHELDSSKVNKKIAAIRSGELKVKPFVVSADNQIMDSHHQWAALKEEDPDLQVPVFKLGVGTEEMIKISSKYNKATFKNITENANL